MTDAPAPVAPIPAGDILATAFHYADAKGGTADAKGGTADAKGGTADEMVTRAKAYATFLSGEWRWSA